MGTIQQGRQGSLGFAFQTDEATANNTPAVYLPFTVNTVQGKHEPIAVQHSVASRRADESSVQGKKMSEGDVALNLDMVNSGYLLKWFVGNEILTTGTPNSHNFYTTVSGNTPKFATLIHTFGDTDEEQYNGVAADTLAIEVSDALATVTVNAKGKFPVSASTQTPTVTSGTVLAFPNYSVQLGEGLVAAAAANPTPVQNFTFNASNNLEIIHSSQVTSGTNSNDVRTIRTKNLEYSGSFTAFFDDVTQRDNYYSLNKRSMIAKFQIGAVETLTLNISNVSIRENDIDTGLDTLYGLNISFTGETDRTQVPNDFDFVLANSKGTVY